MNNLALLRAMAAAIPPGVSGPDPFRPFAGVLAEHKPEHVPDWVQQEKIRKAQEKRDRKAKAKAKAQGGEQ